MADEQQMNQPQVGQNPEQDAEKQPMFGLQRIYIKDLSFESPRSPELFREKWQPQISLDINTAHQELSEENHYEVSLTLTVSASAEDKTIFVAEVKQAGIFLISNLGPLELQHTIGAACPNILFPYARETLDMIAVKASLPPLMLAPINFDALFLQALEKQKQEQEAAGQGAPQNNNSMQFQAPTIRP